MHLLLLVIATRAVTDPNQNDKSSLKKQDLQRFCGFICNDFL